MQSRNKIYLSIAIFLLVFVFVCVLGYIFIFNDLQKAASELQKSKTALAELDHSLSGLEDFRQKKSNFDNYSAEVNQIFVDPQAPIAFLGFLEKESKDLGVSFDISPFSLTKEELTVFGSAFYITVSGGATNVLKFFNRLETSEYLFEISKVNISRFSGKELLQNVKEGDIILSCVLKTFNKK